jgi:hypothetical protein
MGLEVSARMKEAGMTDVPAIVEAQPCQQYGKVLA